MNGGGRACRDGVHCQRSDCSFVHPPGRVVLLRGASLPKSAALCRNGIDCFNKDCQFTHPPNWNPSRPVATCRNGIDCFNKDCKFTHPPNWNPSRPASCRSGIDCFNKDCQFTHPPNWDPFKCRNGINCFNKECTFSHPVNWDPLRNKPLCQNGIACFRVDCPFMHPSGWNPEKINEAPECRNGIGCWRAECTFKHPVGWNPLANKRDPTPPQIPTSAQNPIAIPTPRTPSPNPSLSNYPNSTQKYPASAIPSEQNMESEDDLIDFSSEQGDEEESADDASDTSSTHSSATMDCAHGSKCYKKNCKRTHPSSRPAFCEQRRCDTFGCKLLHPPSRVRDCARGLHCTKAKCKFRHPDRCLNGVECVDAACTRPHPKGRTRVCKFAHKCPNPDCEYLHPDNWNPSPSPSPSPSIISSPPVTQSQLRTQVERDAIRTKVGLPILQSKDVFLDRLRKERVLVVTAETGSGKTTQLPQYAAEAFGGLVVCTQPRALAAVTIAQRVADEFDGTSVGESVGYRIGGGKAVEGRSIMLMTDASLVRMAQDNPALPRVSVLVIDEAHERSLNTDLVVGIAKLALGLRSDFYVVIASATIDPKPFLQFFHPNQTNRVALSVPGRTFPVTLTYSKPDDDVDVLSGDVLVQAVLDALTENTEGHCLVFLPGSREVDTAIRDFKQRAPAEWIALPLYGSLPPEEQQRVMAFEDEKGTLRMVVFCTNVAETSLTVPNVRIVVDTGLAKEARYDPKRRITLLEQVYVSRSSADQRKGRAGRTAPGVCVRLFAESLLVRQNIEPEILRSSLDLVVLQLKRLGHDPLTFPFIDRPRDEFIVNSVGLLTQFGCLSPDAGVITERGRLFSEMPFDPRVSHFVLLGYQEGPALGAYAAEIASIVTAPGSIFFMGGSSKDKREQAKKRIASEAAEHASDLLFLCNTYRGWFNAGKIGSDGACTACKKKIPPRFLQKDEGCRNCRVKFASSNGLNNKVVDVVRSTTQQVHKLVSQYARKNTSSTAPPNSDEVASTGRVLMVLARCLAECFFEQIGQLLMPGTPGAGVYLIESNTKGTFAATASLAQRNNANISNSSYNLQHVIAMSITQTPSGGVFVDQAHPLQIEWLSPSLQQKIHKSSLDITECYVRTNLHPRFRTLLFKHLQADKTAQAVTTFATVVYESETNTLRVYGPRSAKNQLHQICTAEIDHQIQSDLKYEYADLNGELDVAVTVTAGLAVDEVKESLVAKRVRFPNPPISDNNQLVRWISKLAGVQEKDVKWHSYHPATRSGELALEPFALVAFASEELAARALRAFDAANASTQRATLQVSSSAEWGKRVICEFNCAYTVEELNTALALTPYRPFSVQCVFVRPPELLVSIKNLQTTYTDALFKQLLTDLGIANNGLTGCFLRDDTKVTTRSGSLKFANEGARIFAVNILNAYPWGTHVIYVPPKMTQRIVAPQFSCTTSAGTSQFALTFSNITDAETMVNAQAAHLAPLLSGFKALSPQTVISVAHAQLHDLNTISQALTTRFGVVVTRQENRKGGATTTTEKYTIKGAPSACAKAAQALTTATSPLQLRMSSRRQQVLFSELRDTNTLAKLAGYKLHVDYRRDRDGMCSEITVFGPQADQGRLMAQIAEYDTQKFEGRHDIVPLDAQNLCLFRRLQAGASELQKLQESASDSHVSIECLPMHGGIEIYLHPSANLSQMKRYRKEIGEMVAKFGANKLSDSAVACVFCTLRGERQFSICGHYHCRDCLTDTLARRAQLGAFPIDCPRCATLVSVNDLKRLDAKVLASAVASAVKIEIKANPTLPISSCPIVSCGGILKKSDGYSQCPSCSIMVCPLCGAQNKPLHQGVSCAEFARAEELARLEQERQLELAQEQQRQAAKARRRAELLAKFFDLSSFVEQAKKFVQDKWPVVGPPSAYTNIDINPGLERGCPAMQRFCKALMKVGVDKLQSLSFFAWHGTSEAGVIGICNEGYDPKRRAGQAYGVGEYFGLEAAVSHGYVRGSNRMLVNLLLRVPELSTHGNFCYVMNNPLDFSLAYNLPLLVVSFGGHYTAPQFTLGNPQPLPFQIELNDDEETMDVGNTALQNMNSLLKSVNSLDTLSEVPFRWSWQHDDSTFKPYTDSVSELFETHYALFLSGRQGPTFQTPEIIRFVDDRPQRYNINFSANTQQNASTGYTRRIQRQKTPVNWSSANWQVQMSDQRWVSYDSLVQATIESSFRKYVDAGGTPFATISFPGRPESYVLDFVKRTQRNNVSLTERPIRRVLSAHSGDIISIVVPQHILQRWLIVDPAQRKIMDELRGMVQRAAGTTMPSTPPTLSVGPGTITLTTSGVASTIASLLVGRIRAALHATNGETNIPITINDQGSINNPRLMALASPELPQATWSDFNGATLLLAHCAIWRANCTVYGGFVRDWVIRGEAANDIDVALPPASALIATVNALKAFPASLGVPTRVSEKTKGMAHTLIFEGPWGKAIEVDLVDPVRSSARPPGVDADAGNLCINKIKMLHSKVDLSLPLAKAVRHCLAKKIVFFYNTATDQDNVCFNRLSKYLKRGWVCISPLAPVMVQKLQPYQKLLRPKPRYNVQWWNG